MVLVRAAVPALILPGTSGCLLSWDPPHEAVRDSDTALPDDTDTESIGDDDDDGYTVEDGDCDDADSFIHPGASDVCDAPTPIDQDCDGSFDEDPDWQWYLDTDKDGFGDPGSPWPTASCESIIGYVDNDLDCDDSDPAIGNELVAWYLDLDGDGYVRAGNDAQAGGTAPGVDDCDDTDATLSPADGDGDSISACAGDCDDGAAATFPGAADGHGDGTDQNCDGIDGVDGDSTEPRSRTATATTATRA